MKKIAVFFGGESVEHDVSVITGVLTLNALKKSSYLPIPVYVDFKGEWWSGESLFEVESFKNLNFKKLKKVLVYPGDNGLFILKKNKLKRIDSISCAINCMHGGDGENGSLAGALNLSFIPLTSANVLGSSIAMDKVLSKTFLKGLGVKTVNGLKISALKELEERTIDFPVIVKPSTLGSSIGISVCNDDEELKRGVLLALRYSESVLIENYVENALEINCAAYLSEKGVVVSECEKPAGAGKILSFEDKYLTGEREFPANIPQKKSDKIKSITKKVYLALNLTGFVRIDFLLNEQGDIYLNEINTVPGSLAYYLFTPTLEGFSKILEEQIRLSESKFSSKKTLLTKYKSAIFSMSGTKGAKHL